MDGEMLITIEVSKCYNDEVDWGDKPSVIQGNDPKGGSVGQGKLQLREAPEGNREEKEEGRKTEGKAEQEECQAPGETCSARREVARGFDEFEKRPVPRLVPLFLIPFVKEKKKHPQISWIVLKDRRNLRSLCWEPLNGSRVYTPVY
ncbi:MAG: hypothetical protein HYZ25_07950 [Chloroflexi bacterium]|nr:hypothetical protein [Chloroflexota bacterium]